MVISTPLIKAYARLGQKGAAAGIGMLEVAKSDPNLRVVVADSIAIASLDRFYANYPDKVINVGIAEQNMIGIAAGIASESGSNVFACTYAEFIITRTVEMIRQNLSYHQFNVKLIGNSAGFAMETLAVSHWATEDIALVRALPNIIILSASDCLAAIKLVIAASLIKGPVYLRLSGGLNCPIVYEKDCDFTIGKSNIIKKGEDVAILATGLMVREAMDAAEMLKEKNVNKRTIISSYSLKKYNRIVLLSLSCVIFAMWLLYMILSLILFKDLMLSLNGIAFIINSFVYAICSLIIGFLIGNITQNKNAIGGIVNVVALGSSFLCGCFVPFNYMPDYVIKLAHILPTYYFVSNNELIKNMEVFDFNNIRPLLVNASVIIVFCIIFVVLTNFISKEKRVIE